MIIQYAPIIANTVLGFDESGVTIHFTHNQAVAASDVETMRVRIMTLENEPVISWPISAASFDLTIGKAVFPLGYEAEGGVQAYRLSSGNYYKFQIAYSSLEIEDRPDSNDKYNDLVYSSVAIGKCVCNTNEASRLINLTNINNGGVSDTYQAIYNRPNSSNETLYSYEFFVTERITNMTKYNYKDYIIETTGEIFYSNITMNNMYYEPRGEYGSYVCLKINTYNGYSRIFTTQRNKTSSSATFGLNMKLNINKDEGYVEISFENKEEGVYLIERLSSDQVGWDKIYSFELNSSSNLQDYIYKDNTVKHGGVYTYVLRKKIGTIYTKRDYNEKKQQIEPYFEDTFLSDSEKQLKIRFNPKVSSFKNTILEQKTDTIGGTYPFIFRNGQVRYKEIPISGLISYLMDEEELFMSLEELGLAAAGYETVETPGRSTNLTDINMTAERKFKLEVLNWLTNGQPKLFRSPAEGNYIVRLMNVSLSPDDKLSRMLHTFSATGYEIADANDYRNLVQQKIAIEVEVQ